MRIDSSQAAPLLPESGRSGNPSPASAATTASTSSVLGSVLGEDQAQLSGAHVQVQALTAQVLQFPEIRQEKVNTLRQLVLGGSYQPSANQLAEAVLAHMLAPPAA
jgi:flagellar biosynthesis anti-sigma factor FlgM